MAIRRNKQTISDVQLKALRAIADQGGVAIAEGGGWWKGADGKRLEIETKTLNGTVGTSTIYALESRGLLSRRVKRIMHKDTRHVTGDGYQFLAETEKQP